MHKITKTAKLGKLQMEPHVSQRDTVTRHSGLTQTD